MKKFGVLILFIGFIQLNLVQSLSAQTVKIIGNNAIYGGLTGVGLGTATTFIKGQSSLSNIETWAGVGILGGAGIAIYDLNTATPREDLVIHGFFNRSNNSSFIIFLDTIYGAGVGGVIGSATALIGSNNLLDGMKKGIGYGAWIGFGFGIFDSMILAGRTAETHTGRFSTSESIFTLQHNNLQVNVIKPELLYYKDLTGNELSLEIEPVLQVLSVRKSF